MKRFFYSAILSGTVLLTGCKPFQLGVSDELKNNNDVYTVKGRSTHINQKLSFGSYKTVDIKRSWTKGNTSYTGIGFGNIFQENYVNLIGMEYINKKQTLKYSLTNGADTSNVFCVTKFNSKDLQIGKNQNSVFAIGMDIFGGAYESNNTFYVQVFAAKDEKPWQLTLDNEEAQRKPNSYKGLFAKSDTEYYTIHPANKVEKNGKTGKTLFGSVGYEIKNAQGESVAAVNTMDRGTVHLKKSDEKERFLLANLCTAILLQEVIGG